jgi:hypothetical protein
VNSEIYFVSTLTTVYREYIPTGFKVIVKSEVGGFTQRVDIERAELTPPVSEGRGATFQKVLLCCREDFFNISNLSIR